MKLRIEKASAETKKCVGARKGGVSLSAIGIIFIYFVQTAIVTEPSQCNNVVFIFIHNYIHFTPFSHRGLQKQQPFICKHPDTHLSLDTHRSR